ncbi:MAG: Serine/threonine-protein kinase PknB, partial [Verrucomicrobiota bacterium]
MTTPSICPKCGATIPDGAPQGLCPKCVLLGAATEIQSVARPSKAAAPPTVAELTVHFPDLEVLELIGAGGMGAVYKARQPKLDRLVALKVLSSDLAGDPAFAERFDREARLLARLNHPNIVTVFDSGVAGPFAYLLMEFVDGVNLRQAMKAGRFTPPEALALVQDICAALKFAHEQGILHRDIKPENILIDSRGQVKIADFGIAKLTGEEGQDLLTLTQRGSVLGSPHYMAPEQFESPGDVDQRADIYSLGVVLYELLTGELPLGRFAPPSKKSAVDARIDEIVMRTLERERELRFQTVGEVKTQMQAASEPQAAREAQNSGNPAGLPARSAKPLIIWSTLSPAVGVMALVGLVKLYSGNMSSHSHMRELHVFSPVSILLLLLVASAVVGAVQAMRAVRRIRSSGGALASADRSGMTLLIWPSILAAGLSVFGVVTLFHESAVSMVWRLLLCGLLLIISSMGMGI